MYYIFADDIDYVNINCLRGSLKNVIHGNELEDFYLMQHCKHNIIANSTYSFWAAMLNNNPDKYVIYPEDWKCGQRPVDFKDERWISI